MNKIDIHKSDYKLKQAIENLRRDVSQENYILIKDFLEASSIGKTARKNAHKKQVGLRARLKNLFCLKVIAKAINKPLNKLSVKDIEGFIKGLNENTIKKNDGRNYSEQTKANIKVNLIVFLRFYIKDSSKLATLTDWIETGYKKKEIQSLSEEDIQKVLNKCVTLQQKAVISILFDSGVRAEEFLNFRVGDIIEVKGDFPFYRIIVRNEFSKTAGRTINLLWKPTTAILREWLYEHENKNDLEAPLFLMSYSNLRKILFKAGKKALSKSINPHLMRHSSATYYASQGYDYFQLCKRYGWAIGSHMPNTYIDRSGIRDKEQIDKFVNNNIKELSDKLERAERQRVEDKEKYKQELEEFKEAIGGKIESILLKTIKAGVANGQLELKDLKQIFNLSDEDYKKGLERNKISIDS